MVEIFAGERAKGERPAHESVGFVRRDAGEHGEADEGLRKDVDGIFVDTDGLQFASVHHAGGDGALGEIVDVGGDKHAVAGSIHRVPGATDALEGAGDAFGRGNKDDGVDGADVDAQFEGRGADDGAELAAFQAVLDLQAHGAVDGGVVDLNQRREIG
jgi:hypothetical protein